MLKCTYVFTKLQKDAASAPTCNFFSEQVLRVSEAKCQHMMLIPIGSDGQALFLRRSKELKTFFALGYAHLTTTTGAQKTH